MAGSYLARNESICRFGFAVSLDFASIVDPPQRFPSKPAFDGRWRLLVGPAEIHVIAHGVEPVVSRGGRGKHLQRHGSLHFRVVLRGSLQDVVGAQVHHHKLPSGDETDAVSAGLQGLTGDFERDFVEQICLVLLFDPRGVAGAVHHSRENVKIVSKANSTTIAELDWGALAAEKNAFRKNFRSDVCRLEDNFLPFRGRAAGAGGMEMPEGKTQKQECEENEKPRETCHGNSFQNAGIVQHLVSFRKKETTSIGAALAPHIFRSKKAAKRPREWCDILRARLRGCTKERIRMLDRRNFMKACSGMGLAGTLFPGVLWAQAQAQGDAKITKEMIDNAASIADVAIADEYKQLMLDNLNEQAKGYEEIYRLHIPNSVEPALIFDPVLPGMKFETERKPMRISTPNLPEAFSNLGKAGARPNFEALAFASVRELAEMVRTKRVSSMDLTLMYLGRLKRYDPALKFLVTLTEERAFAQAKKADEEIAAGKYRGPLHGLPWGAKDLLATKGYRTTWGAGGFESQSIDEDATVVKRLDQAGAVLVAKLTLGALAMGDVWFGGVTRNPWNT